MLLVPLRSATFAHGESCWWVVVVVVAVAATVFVDLRNFLLGFCSQPRPAGRTNHQLQQPDFYLEHQMVAATAQLCAADDWFFTGEEVGYRR